MSEFKARKVFTGDEHFEKVNLRSAIPAAKQLNLLKLLYFV